MNDSLVNQFKYDIFINQILSHIKEVSIICEQMPSEGNGKCRVMAWVIRINMIDLCHL